MKYVKPEFTVEEFVLNESIAICSAGNDGSTLDDVGIDCLITNHHHIFYAKCTSANLTSSDCEGLNGNCDGIADIGNLSSNSGTVRIITYNNQDYLVWPKDDNNWNSDNSVSTLAWGDGGMGTISTLAKLYYGTDGKQVHAGLITGNEEVSEGVARSL